jgi:nitrate reductase gamma subunit
VQLVLGLITLPYSYSHSDGSAMLVLAEWAQRIVTFRPDAAALVVMDWPYKVHLVLGMTIFLLFPFSRLVHVWSGFGTLAYVFRPYQVVRSRKLGLTPNTPRQP